LEKKRKRERERSAVWMRALVTDTVQQSAIASTPTAAAAAADVQHSYGLVFFIIY
jgi:hypothetical protein